MKEEQLSKNVKNKLVNVFECDVLDTCYYSVYIKELDKYNTFPTETGSYLVYSMLYNPKKNFLMIKEFKYKWH